MDSSPAIVGAHEALEFKCVEVKGEVYVICGKRPAKLPRAARRVLELCDGRRGVTQLCQEAGLGPNKGRAVLRKLATMGVIRRDPAHCDCFDEIDEAFFASELKPEWDDDPPPNLADRVRSVLSRLRARR